MLEQVGKEDLARAGGKGANLGEMIRAGLPVPGGFVLLADAYRKSVAIDGRDVFMGTGNNYKNDRIVSIMTRLCF